MISWMWFPLEDAMEGIDTVIHAAAVVSFDPDKKSTLYKVNIEGTANVVNTALEKMSAVLCTLVLLPHSAERPKKQQ